MIRGYYFITDACLSRHGILHDARAAVRAGVPVIQYRNKYAGATTRYAEARALRMIARGALFLINDHIDLALAVNADGIHCGQNDTPYQLARKLLGPHKVIGVTVHTLEEANTAEKNGADYIAVSPVFKTGTKRDAGRPCGLSLVKAVRSVSSIPIVAIGGIDLVNAPSVIAAGAHALCAISAVVTRSDVGRAIGRFQDLFDTNRRA
ncbi:MAG: thiamine phosphate synthase [Candidatus Omnitrophica bacterium]|nr:thiamine phosphate synthase [Candidatus Omnitrophota bacterium]